MAPRGDAPFERIDPSRVRSAPRVREYVDCAAGRTARMLQAVETDEFYSLLTYRDDVNLEKKLAERKRFSNHERSHRAHFGRTSYEAPREKLQLRRTYDWICRVAHDWRAKPARRRRSVSRLPRVVKEVRPLNDTKGARERLRRSGRKSRWKRTQRTLRCRRRRNSSGD